MSINSYAFDKRYGPLTIDNNITTRNKFIQILRSQGNQKKVKWFEVSKHWKEQIKYEIETQSGLNQQFPNQIMGILDWCEAGDVVNKLQVKIAYQCHEDALPILDYLQNTVLLSDQVKLDLTEKVLFIVCILFQLDVQHFNIKPNNLIYSKTQNSILLTDFGSARTHHYTYSVDPSSNLERKWQQHCWFYCSKQMLEILNNEIDFREQEFERVNSDKNQSKQLYANNDRWALGIILIQMFTNLQQTDKMQEFPALNNKVIENYMNILKQNKQEAIYEAISQLLKMEKTPKEIYEQFQKDRQIQGTTEESVKLSVINPSQQQLMQLSKPTGTKNKTQLYYIPKTEVMKLERVQDEVQKKEGITKIENIRQTQEFKSLDEVIDFEQIEDDSIKNFSNFSSQGADTQHLMPVQEQYTVGQVIDLSKVPKFNQQQQPISNSWKPNEAQVLQFVQDPTQQLKIVLDTSEQRLAAYIKSYQQRAEYHTEAQKLTRITDYDLERKFIKFTEAPKVQNMLSKVELPLLSIDKLEKYHKTLDKLNPQTVQQQTEKTQQLEIIEETTKAQIQLNKFVGDATEANFLDAQKLSKINDSLKEKAIIKLKSQLKKVQEPQRVQIQKQLDLIKESFVESKQKRFVENPNPAQLIQGQPLHEMTDRNKQEYKQVLQVESEKQQIAEKQKIISHQIELIDESNRLQTQLNKFINNPNAEQLLSIWELNKLTPEQSKQYQQTLEKYSKELEQQQQISDQQAQLTIIKDIRSQLEELIYNPQHGIQIEPLKLAYLNLCELEHNKNILSKVENATEEQKKAQSQCSLAIEITVKTVLNGQQILDKNILKEITVQLGKALEGQLDQNLKPSSQLVQIDPNQVQKQVSQLVGSNVKKVVEKIELFNKSPSENNFVTAQQMSEISNNELIRLRQLLQENKPKSNDQRNIVDKQLQEIDNAIKGETNSIPSQQENQVSQLIKNFYKNLSQKDVVNEENLKFLSQVDLQSFKDKLLRLQDLNGEDKLAVEKQIQNIDSVISTLYKQESVIPFDQYGSQIYDSSSQIIQGEKRRIPGKLVPIEVPDNKVKVPDNLNQVESTVLDSAFFAKIHSGGFSYIFSRNEKISRFQRWRQYTAANFNPFNLPNKFVVQHKKLIIHNSDMKREIIKREQREISGYTKDNKLHGLGMMMKLDYYGIYEGIFEDGKFLWGAVLELTPEGLITYYVGPYHEDHQRKNGKCCLQWYKEVAQNQFRLAEQHDGIIIVGLFEAKGKRVKYDLQSNEVKVIEKYEGEWKSNHKDGNGDYTYQVNGQEHRYVGQFKNDRFDGQGTIYLQKCIYQTGKYENGKPIGQHKLYKKKLETDAEGVLFKELQY